MYGAYLAINALAYREKSTIVTRRLELNWYGTNQFQDGGGVIVGLYEREPSNNSADGMILTLDPNDYPDGFYVTDIMLPVIDSIGIGLAGF